MLEISVPAMLGDRVAILLTLEDWHRASARFCYRVIGAQGTPICAGFQSLICADAKSGKPIPIPAPLWDAMEEMRGIEEPYASESFREKTLAGGSKVESLFSEVERNTAVQYLAERYPSPKEIPAVQPLPVAAQGASTADASESEGLEAWVFVGQGAFDAELLSKRVEASSPSVRRELEECAAVAEELVGGNPHAIIGGTASACAAAVEATPGLAQFAIHLQNILGAYSRRARSCTPDFVIGHSFGEIAACSIAGCFDLLTGVRIVCHRVRALAEHGPSDGGMLAVSAGRAMVATEAALCGLDQVVVAGRNHDKQTAVSGPRDQLDRFRDRLQRIHIVSVPIKSPTSFHHPHLRPAASAWLEQMRTLPLQGPSLVVYSPIGRRFISPDEDIAVVLAGQFLRPFDFQGAISDLTEVGVTRFVDCGSPGWLAKIIAKAGDNALDIGGPDMDGPNRGGPGVRNIPPNNGGPSPAGRFSRWGESRCGKSAGSRPRIEAPNRRGAGKAADRWKVRSSPGCDCRAGMYSSRRRLVSRATLYRHYRAAHRYRRRTAFRSALGRGFLLRETRPPIVPRLT